MRPFPKLVKIIVIIAIRDSDFQLRMHQKLFIDRDLPEPAGVAFSAPQTFHAAGLGRHSDTYAEEGK